LTPRGTLPPQAPIISSVQDEKRAPVLVALYPNPASSVVALQYYISKAGQVEISVSDMNGKVLQMQKENCATEGLYTNTINFSQLPLPLIWCL
jgi:hypothetical protein